MQIDCAKPRAQVTTAVPELAPEQAAQPMRVALIGDAFMGRAHSVACRSAPRAVERSAEADSRWTPVETG